MSKFSEFWKNHNFAKKSDVDTACDMLAEGDMPDYEIINHLMDIYNISKVDAQGILDQAKIRSNK